MAIRKKKIRISASIIKKALADYFNNLNSELDLAHNDFQLKWDANRKLFWAVRNETGYEVHKRYGCPFCDADKKYVKEEEDRCEGGVLINKRCTKCGVSWQ